VWLLVYFASERGDVTSIDLLNYLAISHYIESLISTPNICYYIANSNIDHWLIRQIVMSLEIKLAVDMRNIVNPNRGIAPPDIITSEQHWLVSPHHLHE
jgi:hypothetical protein